MDYGPIKLPLILSGIRGSVLTEKGLSSDECAEEWIINHSDIVSEIQAEIIKDGADIILAPTALANKVNLKKIGREDKVSEYNRKLIELTKKSVELSGKKALVAANVFQPEKLEDDFADMDFKEAVSVYDEQAKAVVDAGADLFVIHSNLSLGEIRAAVLAFKEYDKPILVLVSSDKWGKTEDDAESLSVLISLQGMGITAFGVSCNSTEEERIEIIKGIMPYAEIPVAAGVRDDNVKPLFELGVELIDCRSDKVKSIRKITDDFNFSAVTVEKDTDEIVLANDEEVFYLSNDNVDSSEPFECEIDMADDLLGVSSTNTDVITIELNSVDDAYMFSENMHMAELPIMFKSENEEALREALYLYNGRAMIDSNTSIDEEVLKELSEEYGALIY